MKKFLVIGALALAVAACAEDQANAWVNAKFGVGLNVSLQSGGNNVMWGLFRNGQPPVPAAAPAPYGYYPPMVAPGQPYPMHSGPIDAQPGISPAPAPASVPTQLPPTSWIDYPGYQMVSYPYYVPVNPR